MTRKQYAERDAVRLDERGGHYTRHVLAMTAEGLHDKSAIAAELAWRDAQIDFLAKQLDRWRDFFQTHVAVEGDYAGDEDWPACAERHWSHARRRIEALTAERDELKRRAAEGEQG